MHTRRRDG